MIEKTLIDKAVLFHGHFCGGLSIGIRVADYVLRELGHSKDEEIVAVVENNMCAVDAIQALGGQTFGKGNLVHLDYGKMGFSFFRRSDGKSLRLLYVAGKQKAEYVLQAPFEDLFKVGTPNYPMPLKTIPVKTVECSNCGESVIEMRTNVVDGKIYCLPCSPRS